MWLVNLTKRRLEGFVLMMHWDSDDQNRIEEAAASVARATDVRAEVYKDVAPIVTPSSVVYSI